MKAWTQILISPDDKLTSAIKTLDEGGLRIVLVVKNNKRLIGTLTDGDIRRFLLDGGRLDAKVENLMQKNPQIAKQDSSKKDRLKIMRNSGVLQLPIVDDFGDIVELELLDELLQTKKLTMLFFSWLGVWKAALPFNQQLSKTNAENWK